MEKLKLKEFQRTQKRHFKTTLENKNKISEKLK